MEACHIPVLLQETVASFQGVQAGIFVDCTVGFGGHSEAILRRYEHLEHIGFDRDPQALHHASKRLACFQNRSKLMRGSFSRLYEQLPNIPIRAVLADVGVSSLQLDKLDRGFAFASTVLDMRMDPDAQKSAYDVVNGYAFEALEQILRVYGEISMSESVAQAIIRARNKAPIKSAKELSQIVQEVLPKQGKKHPATLVFQAIRIEVNDELGEIERLLDAIERRRSKGQIVTIITFHSLEDRLVKERFKRWQQHCICPPESIRCTCGKNHAKGKILTKKPITPTPQEVAQNPRSRSAKLRTFRFETDG